MKLCFIADAGSPIARNWIEYFAARDHEVNVISTFPCAPDAIPGAEIHSRPIAFAGLTRGSVGNGGGRRSRNSLRANLRATLRNLVRSGPLFGAASFVIHALSPIEIGRHVTEYRELVARIAPDMVHALRIPYEGIIAAKALPAALPLLISVWGNDFTLFAHEYRLIGGQTRQAMRRADALHADCQRDLKLAQVWGFDSHKPGISLPGAGGVQPDVFYPGSARPDLLAELGIPADASVVINPRGVRGYVCNEAFFQAVPLVLQKHPNTYFLGVGMRGVQTIENLVDAGQARANVRLLPKISRHEMADLFRLAQITVSPSRHDGTPNTLLEGLACGCFPVAGDIESLREWIEHGTNGLLCDPTDPAAIAGAITRALEDTPLREAARAHNLRLIAERADYGRVMARAETFYLEILGRRE